MAGWLPLALGSVVLASLGQFLLKLGSRSVGSGFNVVALALDPRIWAGLGLFGISAVLWLKVLSRAALSAAYPVVSLSYVLIVLLSWRYLHEAVTPLKLVGVLTIMVGIALVGLD